MMNFLKLLLVALTFVFIGNFSHASRQIGQCQHIENGPISHRYIFMMDSDAKPDPLLKIEEYQRNTSRDGERLSLIKSYSLPLNSSTVKKNDGNEFLAISESPTHLLSFYINNESGEGTFEYTANETTLSRRIFKLTHCEWVGIIF